MNIQEWKKIYNRNNYTFKPEISKKIISGENFLPLKDNDEIFTLILTLKVLVANHGMYEISQKLNLSENFLNDIINV